jgi:hypothetical protein
MSSASICSSEKTERPQMTSARGFCRSAIRRAVMMPVESRTQAISMSRSAASAACLKGASCSFSSAV